MFASLTGFFRRKDKLFVVLFVIAVVAAGAARWWAAPLSSGPDAPQFWAFARVFQLHGLNFYQYAEATADIFPLKYWGYVYPPVWLLILRVCLCAVPGAYASEAVVDTAWRLAIKTPIIMADLAIGCLLFWAVPGSKARKLAFASLWLFHPTAWYESAVFGQFDALSAVFLVASLAMLVRHRDGLAFLLAGLALVIKQHAFIPIAGMMAAGFHLYRGSAFVKYGLILAVPLAAFSIPFLLNGNLTPYAQSVFLPAQAPVYQHPLDYAFSGTGSLLTHLHDVYGWETEFLLKYTIAATIIVLAVVLVGCHRKRVNPVQAALASFLVFIALFYRINYQYLIIYIPLALLVAAMTRFRGERVMALVLTLLPAVWLWLYDVSFWFNYLEPTSPWVTPYLENIGMAERSDPHIYVIFAVTLMCLSLAYVGLVLTRWHGRRDEGG